MTDAVVMPIRGLELYASERHRTPLPIGGSKTSGLAKIGIESVQDLLQHYPRRHVDRTKLRTIAELGRMLREDPNLGEVSVHGRVAALSPPIRTKTGKRMIRGKVADETGQIDVSWFNQDWVARALSKGTEAFFYGKIKFYGAKLQMTAPRIEIVRSGKEPFNVGRIVPIYPASADVTSDTLRRFMWDALKKVGPIADPLPASIRERFGFMTRGEAIRLIHFPDSREDVEKARERIIFDELFTLQLGLVYRKKMVERTVQGIEHEMPGPDSLANVFIGELPFELTGAQKQACADVAKDMAAACPMHRLLEGEVGSGKTVVALFACLMAVGGGYQAAFMAPTEVLAEQHHLTVKELLDRAFGEAEGVNLFAGVSRRPVVRLLTGSTPAATKNEILGGVASGEVDLLIGTHALIQESVDFARLGVAVVDEQHRFGVHQRKALRDKGAGGEPDILVMTATPIPRTLAVTVYGDLDVSVLDELPKGRKPIDTGLAFGDADRSNAYALIRNEVSAGRQAFIVYALRDESDKVESRSAKAEAKRLALEVFPDLQVGLVHGDMKSADKEEAMASFRDGKTNILVATTVIEVGVDVPNATVMMIEDAERFGLAQLHQLRGRVGRGEHASHCILATDIDPKEDPPGLERLQAVVATTDGFELALEDLKQRGEGEIFGARQSGLPKLKLARVLQHREVVLGTRRLADEILEEDPELRAWDHMDLAREMRERFPPASLEVVQAG